MSQPLYGTAQYGVDRYDFLFDRQAIVTINHTLVGSSTHTDFPVLVTGTYDFLKSASNGGDVQHSSGYDICFSATDGSVLAHEIEKYDPATGEIVVWVKVPTLSHTVDTVIHLLYGCPEVSTSLENPTGVWDAHFKGVYHLKDGATLSAADSTSNAFNGTITGATAVTGKVGGGADFDGNDKITLGSPHQYSDITVSGWVYPTANNNIETFWSNWTATNGLFIFRYGAVGGTVWLYWPNAAGTDQYITSTSVAALNTWTHVAFSFDASGNAKLYFNGVQEASTTSNRKNTTATAAQLGANPSGGDFYCKSILDEFRVSNSIRSADWLLAEYNNVSNASFVTVRQAGRYISGRARILRQETQSITGTARVKHERTQSIAGVVRVLRNEAQTITGVSRVLRNESQSITGAARVKHERTENITGTARISQARTESITGVSFLK